MVKEHDKLSVIFDEIRESKRVLHHPDLASRLQEMLRADGGVLNLFLELESLLNAGTRRILWLAEIAERWGDNVALRILVNKAADAFLQKLAQNREKFTAFEQKYLGSLIELARESVKSDKRLVLIRRYPFEVEHVGGEEAEEEEV